MEKSALSLATGFNCQAAKLPSISVSQDLQEPGLDCWIMTGKLSQASRLVTPLPQQGGDW